MVECARTENGQTRRDFSMQGGVGAVDSLPEPRVSSGKGWRRR